MIVIGIRRWEHCACVGLVGWRQAFDGVIQSPQHSNEHGIRSKRFQATHSWLRQVGVPIHSVSLCALSLSQYYNKRVVFHVVLFVTPD